MTKGKRKQQPQRQKLWGIIGIVALFLLGGLIWGLRARPTVEISSADAEVLAMGEAVYAAQCAACHGANLEGEANWKERRDDGTYRAPPHDESGHTWHHGDSYILDRIRNGNAGLDPQMQQASNMIAYKDILSEEEIMAVLAYIKSQWPDDIRAMQAQRE